MNAGSLAIPALVGLAACAPLRQPAPPTLVPTLVQASRSAVVRVCAVVDFGERRELVILGTGFVAGPGGLVATALHVVDLPEGARVVVLPYDRDKADLNRDLAEIVARDADHDLALLRVQQLNSVKPLAIATSPSSEVGSTGIVLGFPFGDRDLTVVGAMIAAKVSRVLDGAKVPSRLFKLDAAVNRGNSGGPLIDLASGLVVGVVNQKEGRLSDNLKIVGETRATADMCAGDICVVKTLQETIRDLDRFIHLGLGYAVSSEHLSALVAASQ